MKTLKIVLNIFYAIICVYRCTAQEYSTSVDSLCYLTDGGSSQTFIVNEASPVNTVLGNLQVIGRTENNKSKPPEIELKIERVELSGTGSYALNENQQLETPIYIDNKQLILSRQLDREAPEGENGITVHIKCTRLIHTDSNNQPIYIPIRIIITDANDHSPVFLNAPYTANVSESAPIFSQLLPAGIIRAVDGDQEGPFSTVQYNVLPGPFSHMVRFESPLGGALLLASPLDFENQPRFWVEITALDQGEPPRQAVTKVNINVIDADDQNPRFLDEKYTSIWNENLRIGDQLEIHPRPIKAIDPDLDINAAIEYQFNTLATMNEQDIVTLDPVHGTLKIARNLPVNAQFPRTYVLKAVQCHLIVQASDTGQPPRTSSVPVTVQLPPSFINVFSNNIPGSSYDLDSDKQELNELNLQENNVYTGSTGSACSQTSSTHSPDGQLNFQHQLFTGGSSSPGFDTQLLPQTTNTIRINSSTSNRLGTLLPNGLDNPMFQPKTSFKTLELDSAIVSDVSSSEGGNFLMNKNNNPPPPPSSMAIANNNLIWSQQNGSIPRRVKKLTWEDEKFGGYGSTSLVCSGVDRLINYNKRSNGFELDPDSRVVSYKNNERNFNIFYQLITGADIHYDIRDFQLKNTEQKLTKELYSIFYNSSLPALQEMFPEGSNKITIHKRSISQCSQVNSTVKNLLNLAIKERVDDCPLNGGIFQNDVYIEALKRRQQAHSAMPEMPRNKVDKSFHETRVTTLSNGLKVASEPKFGQFCTVGVLIDSGPRYELSFLSGISHFLEKLSFNKTEIFDSKDQILQELEKHGGICDCQGSRDSLIYAASIDSRNVESILNILSEVVLRPQITDNDLDIAKQIVNFELQDIDMRPDQETVLMEMIHAAAFRGNTLGLPKLCPLENIEKMTKDIIYNYLKLYHDPSRIVLAGVGVDHDSFVELAEKYFNEKKPIWVKDNSLVSNSKINVIDNSIAQYTGGIQKKFKDLSNVCPGPSQIPELAHFVLGFESSPHKLMDDFVPTCVLNMMMGGGGSFSAGGPGKGMYTRLYTNVLNRYYWMYNATAYNHGYSDSGLFCIHASSDPNKVRDLIKVICSEARKMAGKIDSVELKRAKAQLKSMLLMNLESKPVMFEDMARQVLANGERKTAQFFIEEIDKIEEGDIIRVADRMLKSKISVAALGDVDKFPDIQEIENELSSGQSFLSKRLNFIK
ncbi:hypothetical protein RND71_043317 [Anisodus tanguticus]|uniref:Mitochondrial-processing peptidase subunit alpha n=1 Tax=Anisodus tanguticus TaxID=243964 RepID=A0AAE1QR66_9SOLA|nr:hypothetical protein RND71_043317 [Anisodus tanguticus]